MSNCIEKLNRFCLICGKYMLLENKVNFYNSRVEDIYKMYFELETYPDEPWTPKHCCRNCYNGLLQWAKGISLYFWMAVFIK